MNTRQKIRAGIVIFMVMGVFGLAYLSPMYLLYASALQQLIMPFTIVLGGYFGVEAAKNIKFKKK